MAVVERAEAGGVCLNWGCIPTKALLKSAQVYNYCKSAEHYGLDFAGEVRPNLEKIVARSRGVAETMNKGVLFLLKKNNVELINGFAKLKGNGRIDVDGTEYEADHIILATGARPREMPFMPIDGEHVISSKQALVLPKLPETMIVVGSGAIGSEFAYFYAALGVNFNMAWLGIALTGVFASRGANYVSDLVKKLQALGAHVEHATVPDPVIY